jgi:periplasmic protein TonB
MNKRRFAMPALCSVGLHAGLVLMYAPESRLPLPLPPPTATLPITPREAEVPIPPPDEPDAASEPSPGPRRGIPAPSGEDLDPGGPAGPFTVPIEPPSPGERGLRTLPGAPGVPDGVENGLSLTRIETGPIDYTRLDRTPDARVRPSPVYPPAARRDGLEGSVVIDFAVDVNGGVVSARVVSSTAKVFEEPALAAVSKWRFEPGTRRGMPVSFRMRQTVLFNLNE